MLLEEITLQNFRAYRGRQSLDLRPASPRKPIVLISGLNGSGKTTLLEALHLALYGKLAPSSRSDGRAYEKYVEGCLHHGDQAASSASVAVKFSHTVQGERVTYQVRRSWTRSRKGLREQLEARRDGELSKTLSEDWAQFIEELLPSRLAPLFFFDGEKIEALADLEATSEVLSVAIHSLLGLDLVDQLGSDLETLERRKVSERRGSRDRDRLEELERQVEEARSAERAHFEDCTTLQSELGKAKKRLLRAQRKFEAGGGRAYEARRELEQAHHRAREELREAEDSLRQLAEGLAPLLLVEPLLQRVAHQVTRERGARENLALASLLEQRDAVLVKRLQTSGAPRAVLTQVEGFLAKDRTERRQSEEVEEYLGLSREGEARVSELLRSELPGLRRQLTERLKHHEGASAAVDACEQRLASVPEEGAVARLREARDQARQQVRDLEKRLAAAEATHEASRRMLEQREKELRAEMHRHVEQELAIEDGQRILVHSQRVRETLAVLRQRVLVRHIERIQGLVLDGFRRLLRKTDLVAELEIDPADFSLHLYGPKGQRILPEQLSAGERQLLAVSLLWGLARASGRPMPTLIDTPLGRLDSAHRMHLVERYFPDASHQVLLLSTDEEIRGAYLQKLRPRIGKEYLLEYDEGVGASTIRQGSLESALEEAVS